MCHTFLCEIHSDYFFIFWKTQQNSAQLKYMKWITTLSYTQNDSNQTDKLITFTYIILFRHCRCPRSLRSTRQWLRNHYRWWYPKTFASSPNYMPHLWKSPYSLFPGIPHARIRRHGSHRFRFPCASSQSLLHLADPAMPWIRSQWARLCWHRIVRRWCLRFHSLPTVHSLAHPLWNNRKQNDYCAGWFFIFKFLFTSQLDHGVRSKSTLMYARANNLNKLMENERRNSNDTIFQISIDVYFSILYTALDTCAILEFWHFFCGS